MTSYILRRLLLIIPTLIGIMLINFLIIQFAPGGPIESIAARYAQGGSGGMLGRVTGSGDSAMSSTPTASGQGTSGQGSGYRGARGLDPQLVAQLRQQFGFDKPMWQRFTTMIGDYFTFNFGTSFFKGRPVIDLIRDKLPVSISLGLWTTLLTYLISIPLGIAKAVRHGSRFDLATSAVIVVGYAIPSFLFAVFLIVLFAGGSFLSLFPLRGLVSDNVANLSPLGRALDYAWHLVLPVTAMVIGSFATLTFLTKNSFLEEIGKQYVVTARAKGLTERRILYGHVFRNAMLIVIAGFPAAFVGILFTSSLLIEVIFSLDGLGLLGFEAAEARDYPLVFGTLYLFSLIGLITNLISDVVYTLVDPRIDFERRDL